MTTNNPPYGDPEYPHYPHQGESGDGQARHADDTSGAYGQPPYARSPYEQSPYAQGYYPTGQYGSSPYRPSPYPQVQYGQSGYAPGQHGQDPYGYGQPSYGQPSYGQASYGQYGYPAYPGPQTPTKRRRARGWIGAVTGGALAAVLVIGAVAFSGTQSDSLTGSGSTIQLPQSQQGGGSANGSNGIGGGLPNGGSSGSSSGSGTTTANATQQIGIVTIVSVLKYQRAESAGTGMIVSSDGEILTNNHVVNGATSITVTVETTGKSYRADVVGTAPTKDVAVLKLRNASGLQTADLADSASDVKVGDSVVGVGNAGGTGTLTAAAGTVSALNQSITATDESGQEAERLHNLIEINAPIKSGDSGGPLYDSDGEVIGIDTAASSNQAVATTGYAIRIDNALSVADQIESGVQTATIHIGLPGFLGIQPAATAGGGGVAVPSLVQGGAADKAGIAAGSVITAIDGKRVTTTTALHNALAAKDPGTKVSVSWTDPNGSSHTKSVTLGTGPAD